MKKQISLLKVQATLDGVTFYQRKGVNLVRMASGPSKDQILTSPSFEKLRKNMSEFGAGMKPIKAFYKGLKKNDRVAIGSKLSLKLAKIFRSIISRYPGERGQRPLQISMHKALLAGVDLKDNLLLDDVFSAPFSLSANATRNEVTLTVAPFVIGNHVERPTDATHFQLVNYALALSDYAFSNEDKSYNPVNLPFNGKYARAVSDFIALDDALSPNISVVATLPEIAALNDTTSLLSLVGIRFYEKIEENYYATPTNAAMSIAEVF
ncbi:MAG TPA: hypothetical protein VD908_03980 [Cytophagales bacterium]|nr:hypothetical protein [Cytophagales bacterium]